jgi:hypothetical protein
MGFIIGIIIFGIPSAIIAGSKGFKPLRWLIAFGVIGLIVVASLSSAKAQDISSDEATRRAEKANNIGGWMAGINIALGLIFFLIVVAANA